MKQALTTTDAPVGCSTVPVRTYRSTEPSPWTIVFAHGGGFSWGTLDDYDQICRNMCLATGAELVSIDYRLAPKYPFPCGLDDVCSVVREVTSTVGAGRMVAVAGDSAGGCLAAGAAQRLLAEEITNIAAQLLIYPMIEYYDRTPSAFHTLSDRFHPSYAAVRNAWDTYLQSPVDRLPSYAVPPRAPSLAGLPPAMTIVAENDPLRFEAIAYAQQLAAAGVTSQIRACEGTAHGFLNEPAHGSAAKALADISGFLSSVQSGAT